MFDNEECDIRKHKWKYLFFYFLGVSMYCMWVIAFYNMVATGELFPYSNTTVMIIHLVRNYISVSADFIAVSLVVFALNRNVSRYKKILYDLVLSFVAIVITGNIMVYIIMHGDAGARFDWPSSIINYLIILLINEMCYFFYTSNASLRKAEKAQRTAIQLQYDVLKAQVNPHFLFNSLNILYSMSSIDVEKTRECILALSKMYRYILSKHEEETVKLNEELMFLQSYIDVLQIRYHNCLFFNVNGLEKADQHEIIPYCTQLLIENVIKHNIIEMNAPMTVGIDILDHEMTISNRINKKISQNSSRIGLRYLKELYEHKGKKFYFTNDGETFTAHIPFLQPSIAP